MRLILLHLLLISAPLWAKDISYFRNDREEGSIYRGKSFKRSEQNALRQIPSNELIGLFHNLINEDSVKHLCSFELLDSFENRLKIVNTNFQEMKGSVIHLRYQNEIDDVVTGIFLKTLAVIKTDPQLPKIRESLINPDNKTLDFALDILKDFEKKFNSTCLEESYPTLYQKLINFNKTLRSEHLEAIWVEAFERKILSKKTYLFLEKLRLNQFNQNVLSLNSYHQKLTSLRKNYPLNDMNERSLFITQKNRKSGKSRRQELLQKYSELQIIMMGNVIKKLRSRLESPRGEIHIFDSKDDLEVITLGPMERFRLAIKLLRREMTLLQFNTYFGGIAPTYVDLMTAAFEIGVIRAEELDEVASLEEIWNPKKTLWEKSQIWIRTFGTIASIAVPPPYGFLPVLALVVIEMTTQKPTKTDDPTVLF